MEPLLFVITVDDAGLDMPRDREERSIRFFREQGVPASFFVIPETMEGRGIGEDAEWIGRARAYEREGFDFQLHGCRHEGFEFGPPEPWMVRICGPDMVAAESEGFKSMRHLWTDEALRGRLDRGMARFREGFGRAPEVFRAGCLAAQADAFRIMAEKGLRFDSNRIVNPRAWDLIAGDTGSTRPWDPAVPPRPYRLSPGVTELPCMGEYAWELTETSLPLFTGMAEADMDAVHGAGGIFILMCHQQEVGKEDDLSRRSLAHIFDHARRRHDARFLTLRDLAAQVDRGVVPVADGPGRSLSRA
jgi:peptidoglycan/xylan/chitin deacetylase (PgdA/CDA1 family)